MYVEEPIKKLTAIYHSLKGHYHIYDTDLKEIDENYILNLNPSTYTHIVFTNLM